jgi:hypothetical protein
MVDFALSQAAVELDAVGHRQPQLQAAAAGLSTARQQFEKGPGDLSPGPCAACLHRAA